MSVASTTIRPFKVNIPEAELKELHARVVSARLGKDAPSLLAGYEAGDGEADRRLLGVGLRLAQGGGGAKLNSYPQFLTEIDGVDIHFLHVRSSMRVRCR